MRVVTLIGDHKERLVAAVIHLGNENRSVDHEARLAELIITTMRWGSGIDRAVLIGNILVQVRVQIRVLEHVISGTMDLIRSVSNDNVGDRSVAVANLGIED